MEEGLRRWLAEDSYHAREFELATDVWNESCGQGRRIHRNISHPVRIPRFHRLSRAIVASAAAAILVVAGFIQSGREFQVSTRTGEQKTIILSDGSRLTLNTNTRILIHYTENTRTVILEYGEAYFDVVHNGARPFVVSVGDRRVVDLGTRFLVNRAAVAGDSLTVAVIEGRVAVAPMDATDIVRPQMSLKVHIVSAGQILGIRPHSSPVIRSVSLQVATAWLNGQLIFDSTSLDEAAAEFNRYSPIQIKVLSREAAHILVGGVFRIGDSASFARAVAESHHLRLISRNDELVLESSNTQAAPGNISLPSR